MSKRKLILATVPMCPHCGHEITDTVPGGGREYCNICRILVLPVLGYYEPESTHDALRTEVKLLRAVAGDAVALMRSVSSAIEGIPGCRDQMTRLLIMAMVLEMKND